MTKPLKLMAASLVVCRLVLNGVAFAPGLIFALSARDGDSQNGGNVANSGLNSCKPQMWNVTVRSSGPNELGQEVIGPANCLGKPVTLHANITPAPGRKIQYAWTVNGRP